MRVLLDECVPRKFQQEFTGHDCTTVPEAGLAGRKNGDLLALAERQGFEVFITMDRGIRYEQNLVGRSLAIIIIRAKSNRLVDLLPHASACLAQMRSIRSGQVVLVGV
jgi:predicted nuclease of predicted toxin-antitoxin system